MEQWSSAPQLSDWQTNSYPMTLPPYDPYIVRQDNDSYADNYSANFYGNGVMKPFAKATFALSIRPTALSLWYKLSFPPCINEGGNDSDTVSVKVEVLQNGTVVDAGYWESTTSIGNYTSLNIPISQNAIAFDSCRITILGGKVYGGCGIIPAATEFRVDELSFVYTELPCVDSSQIDLTTFCPGVFMPVCGCNGITYSNACEAEYFGGVNSWTDGECTSTQTGHCDASFSYTKNTDTVNFINTSSAASFTGFQWAFGDGDSSSYFNPQHIYSHPGWYAVCLTISGLDSVGNTCSDIFCDSIYVSDGCVDSSLICPPGSLCCDAPMFDEVCGCNGITYTNACIASLWGGVLSYTPGPCLVGINDIKSYDKAKLVPNPAQSEVSLLMNFTQSSTVSAKVKNLLGQELIQVGMGNYPAGQHKLNLNISHLSTGIYLVEATINGKIENQLLMVNN